MFRDNRQFIQKLESTGDIVKIKQEVDWDLEVGAIIRRTNEIQGPAPLFEKLKDYPSGYSIFGSPLGTHRRLSLSLGMSADSSIKAMQDEYEPRNENLIKPVIVSK